MCKSWSALQCGRILFSRPMSMEPTSPRCAKLSIALRSQSSSNVTMIQKQTRHSKKDPKKQKPGGASGTATGINQRSEMGSPSTSKALIRFILSRILTTLGSHKNDPSRIQLSSSSPDPPQHDAHAPKCGTGELRALDPTNPYRIFISEPFLVGKHP